MICIPLAPGVLNTKYRYQPAIGTEAAAAAAIDLELYLRIESKDT